MNEDQLFDWNLFVGAGLDKGRIMSHLKVFWSKLSFIFPKVA
ncbi:MAG: hypothetical protein ACYC6P_02220 [Ignavibacteriaceae bacterium]